MDAPEGGSDAAGAACATTSAPPHAAAATAPREPPDATADLLSRTHELLSARQWHACIKALTPGVPCPTAPAASSTAPPEPPATSAASPTPTRAVMQALAVASVHFHAAARDWHAVLRLPDTAASSSTGPAATATSAHAVRQQFRFLATLIHPDKCPGLPHASEAFDLLNQAKERLLSALDRPKRRKLDDGGSGVAAADASDDGGTEFDSDDGGASGYEWWGTWDVPADPRQPPSTQPTAADEAEAEAELWGMTLQELKQEVALRQRLVLAPGPAGSAMPIHERQRKLRAARSVLSERLAQGRQGGSCAEMGFSLHA